MKKLMTILLAVVMLGLPLNLAYGAGAKNAAGLKKKFRVVQIKRAIAAKKKQTTSARWIKARKIAAQKAQGRNAKARKLAVRKRRAAAKKPKAVRAR
jgi:hypothetical protein